MNNLGRAPLEQRKNVSKVYGDLTTGLASAVTWLTTPRGRTNLDLDEIHIYGDAEVALETEEVGAPLRLTSTALFGDHSEVWHVGYNHTRYSVYSYILFGLDVYGGGKGVFRGKVEVPGVFAGILEEAELIFFTDGGVLYLREMYSNCGRQRANPSVCVWVASSTHVGEDSVSPVLEAFDLNVDSGTLTLHFSETVNGSALKMEEITLQDNENATASLVFTGQEGEVDDGVDLLVLLTVEDLNAIKAIEELATDESNARLSFTSSAVEDMNGVAVEAIAGSDAITVTVFTEDTTAPELVAFDLDMDNGEIIMTFTETVDVSSVGVGGLTLRSASDDIGVSVLNISGGELSEEDSTVITLSLSSADISTLKQDATLATSRADSYLSLASSTVVDMNGNGVVAVESLQVTSYTADETRPSLENFDVDIDAGTLLIRFSEPVNASSFDSTKIVVQNSIGSIQHRLTGGSHSDANDFDVTLTLSTVDINALKNLDGVTTTNANTFADFNDFLVYDMAGRAFAGLDSAVPVNAFVADVSAPVLVRFALDMNVSQAVLEFDEPVDVSTFELLTRVVTIGDDDGTVLIMTISESDIQRVKLETSIATGEHDTTIQLLSDTILDKAAVANGWILTDLCRLYNNLSHV